MSIADPPDDADAPPTLLIMHIAKTGGTSLRQALADAYSKHERAFIYDPADLRGALSREQFRELPRQTRDQLRLVMGHFPYGIHEHLDRPYRYATIIREPVDRVVSLYHHYRSIRGLRRGGPAREEQAKIRQEAMTLEDWVFGRRRLAVDNGMTRTISARKAVPFGECPADLLEEAVNHIERDFEAVLMTSDLKNSREQLARLTGRRLGAVSRKNVNKRRPPIDDFDPLALERIRDLNRLDVQLYEYARSRLGAS